MLTNPDKELYLNCEKDSGFFMYNLAQSRAKATNRYLSHTRNVPFYLEDEMPKGIYLRTPEMKIGKYVRTEYHKNILLKNREKNIFQKGYFKKGHLVSRATRLKQKEAKIGKQGEFANNWKGGKQIHNGYVYIYKPEHPFCNSHRQITYSRLVMEKHLGRYLNPKEVVHHINKIKTDNRIENLILFKNNTEHLKYHRKGVLV